MNKNFTTGLILGICIVVAGLSAYFMIKTSKTVAQDHATLVQIVQLINNSQKQQAEPTPTK